MRSTAMQDGLEVALVLGCGAALVAAGKVLGRDDHSSPAQDLDQVLGEGMSFLGTAVITVWLIWLVLAFIAGLLHRAGRPSAARVVARLSPAVMRRLMAAVIGVNLLAVPTVAQAAPSTELMLTQHAGPASSAWAAAAPTDSIPAPAVPAGSPYWSVGDAGARPDMSFLDQPTVEPSDQSSDQPDRQTVPGPPRTIGPGWKPPSIPAEGGLLLRQETRPTTGPVEVVVAPGDSLWSITAAHLGPLAGPAEVAEAWPAWFEVNRSTIGDDPSLLIPGQVLHAPPP